MCIGSGARPDPSCLLKHVLQCFAFSAKQRHCPSVRASAASDCSSAAQRSAEVSAMNTLWNPNRITRAWLAASLAFALTGCFQEKSDHNDSVDTSGAPTVTPAAPATPETSGSPAAINHSPDITGDPP